jgi:hypothetical protein
MIKLENYEVVGWEHAIRGMRNPMNSWKKGDSCASTQAVEEGWFDIGPNDHSLMMKLANGGPVHAKYRRMITVYVDITAPLYWWKEFDTYKVGTVANSCSTMHKIHDKEFTLDDFSCEHLSDSMPDVGEFDHEIPNGVTVWGDGDVGCLAITCSGNYHEGHSYEDTLVVSQKNILDMFIIPALNFNREAYLKAKTKPMKDDAARKELMKKYWWQMIQLLPSSYNQKRTVMLNYEVLVGIYKWRKDHKLDEWREFCKWIESLPYSEIITGGANNEIRLS